MFKFRINHNIIILLFILLFINSCGISKKTDSKIIIDNSISKQIQKNNHKVENKSNKIIIKSLDRKLSNTKLNNQTGVFFEFSNERILQGTETLILYLFSP